MADTLTLDGKQYNIADLNDNQKKLVAEANTAGAEMARAEYTYFVMKSRYDYLVKTLKEELDGGAEAEA